MCSPTCCCAIFCPASGWSIRHGSSRIARCRVHAPNFLTSRCGCRGSRWNISTPTACSRRCVRSIRRSTRRMWGHRAVCEPRPYPNLQKPISLMTLDYRGSARSRAPALSVLPFELLRAADAVPARRGCGTALRCRCVAFHVALGRCRQIRFDAPHDLRRGDAAHSIWRPSALWRDGVDVFRIAQHRGRAEQSEGGRRACRGEIHRA